MGVAAWTVTRREGAKLDLYALVLKSLSRADAEGGNSLAGSIPAHSHLRKRAK